MADKIWDKPIDDNTDWGGDASTGNLPVSGRIVQQYIKDKFSSKAGCFHYDNANNRYMVFADEPSRDAYLDSPQENASLLIGVFDAPFNYSAEIYLLSDSFNAVLKGNTGNYIRFSFDVKNKNGQSTGDDVICTFTFVHGAVRKTVSQKYRAGSSVSFNIDQYLETGANTVTVAIVGQNTLAATTAAISYQVVDLALSDDVDISRVYKPEEDVNIEIPYSVSGAGIKTMEWYLDGILIPYVKEQDEVTEIETSRIKYIPLEGVSEGVHSLQYRASVIINGEKFYSNILYRDIIVYNDEGTDNMVAIGTTLPSTADIVGEDESLRLYGVRQYMTYPIRIGLFNPSFADSTPLGIYVDSMRLATLDAKNGEEITYNILLTSYGEKVLKIATDNSEYLIGMDVEPSETSVEEITQSLSLALSAAGKSNNAADRDNWSFGDFSTVFNNFKWLDTCGWKDNSLVISEGASISVDYAPLASDSVKTGKTFEIEFASSNVNNNDAVICDIRNDNGAGILITASEASITSAGGTKVSTKYKAEEYIRIAFVINRAAGVTNKSLVMIYINGILSGAANYANSDNFFSDREITVSSSDDANIILRSVRVYDIALSSNQILNNYILYRPTAEEFLDVYYRNDVYEDGSTDFSTDKLMGQIPVMIITGNIPALEATTDKNLQIDVDVEYINLQNPELSFTLKNAALRPQGTSSMAYPKKNLRLYSQKKDNTILYDADGNVVESKLYAFKAGAQPVNCWCFKADYAESSGTHNTGVARLWNDVFKNFQINGEYKGRTNAQQAAIDGNYPYDVRTCIDGFPIVMFYRLDENSPLVFMGKYNFNNDKSTEAVFGYKDIPGFDNSNVQCWEVLTNGNHLALFQDVTNWEEEWSDAFEARYPDGNEDTAELKAFASWMSSVSQSDFASQKWDHFDVYKVAAYYIYLMRFGAVDQTVKNSMLTTEDGSHWFFENYDNDTIGSLRNDSLLIYSPTIDRQSLDPTFTADVYAYAGHDSRLWNMLEADDEFMSIVREVDQALFSAGLSYDKVIDMFDSKQAGKWCERIYNQDAQYKYIRPFTDRGINNLFMLQGSRQSHRRWWFSERFALFDSLFVSGEYKSDAVEVKLAGAPAGLEFGIKAGKDHNYGYGVNNVPIDYGINISEGDSHTFSTKAVLNVGDPLRIYAAPYIEEIDITGFAPYIAQLSIANVFSERLGSKLKSLAIGKAGSENNSLSVISGINQAKNLEVLSIVGFKAITYLDLSQNRQLKRLWADDSGLTSLALPKGAPVSMLRLPANLQSLNLNGLHNLYNTGLFIQNRGAMLTAVEILDCPNLDTKTLVEDFLLYKSAEDNVCSLVINGINWTDVDPVWLIRLGNFRHLSLKGVIEVTDISLEQLTAIRNIFGNNCFSPKSELYIKAPVGTYFIGPDTVRGYSNTKYDFVVAGAEGSTELYLENNTNDLISFANGRLIVGDITSNTNVTLVAKFVNSESGVVTFTRKTISCVAIVYPTSCEIEWDRISINSKGTYDFNLNISGSYDDDVRIKTEWSVEGDAVTNGNIELGTTSVNKATVICNNVSTSDFTIRVVIKRESTDTVLASNELMVYVAVGNIIMTKETNPNIMATCYTKGWCASPNYMTEGEASAVTEIGDAFTTASACDADFSAFQYFINVNLETLGNINRKVTNIIISHDDAILNSFLDIDTITCLGKTIRNNYLENTERKNYKLILQNALIYHGRFHVYNHGGFTVTAPKLKEIYCENNILFQLGNPSSIDSKNTINFPEVTILKCGYLCDRYVRYINLPKVQDQTFSLCSYESDSFKSINMSNCIKFSSGRARLAYLEELNIDNAVNITIGTSYTYNIYNSIKITNLNLPQCETLEFHFNDYSTNSIESIYAPKLKQISGNLEKAKNLKTFDFVENIEHISSLTLPADFLKGELHFKKLNKITIDYRNTYSIFGSQNITKIYLEQEIKDGSYFSIDRFLNSLGENITELYIHKLNTYSSNTSNDVDGSNATSLKKVTIDTYYNSNNNYVVPKLFENFSNLETIEIGKTNNILGVINCPKVTKISFDGTYSTYNISYFGEGFPNLQVPHVILKSLTSWTQCSNTNAVIEILEFNNLKSVINKFLNNLTNIHTITFNQNSFPTITDSTAIENVGTSVPEGTPKVIYIQVGATGFDDKWQAFCDATGFTVSYTLSADETNTES